MERGKVSSHEPRRASRGRSRRFRKKSRGLAHRWILSRLQKVAAETVDSLDNYYFNQYAQVLYQFLWHEYCDWYLEIVKPDLYGGDAEAGRLARSVAAFVLRNILVLLHPVMPFITEEIWQRMKPYTSGSIMKATFPEAGSRLSTPKPKGRWKPSWRS